MATKKAIEIVIWVDERGTASNKINVAKLNQNLLVPVAITQLELIKKQLIDLFSKNCVAYEVEQ